MPWSARFDDPIVLRDGHKLITLKDAALYIGKFSKAEHDAPEWQAAGSVDLGCGEQRGDDARPDRRMRALNRHHVGEFNPIRKDHHWEKRKLKRDQ